MSLIYDAIRENEAAPTGPMAGPQPGPAMAVRRERGQASPWPAIAVFLVIVVLGAAVLAWWYHARKVAFTPPVTNEGSTTPTPAMASVPLPKTATVEPVATSTLVENTAIAAPQTGVSTLSAATSVPAVPVTARTIAEAGLDAKAQELSRSDPAESSAPERSPVVSSAHGAGFPPSEKVADAAHPPAIQSKRTARPEHPHRANVEHTSRKTHPSVSHSTSAAAVPTSGTRAKAITPARTTPVTAHQAFDSFMQAMRSNDLAAADSRLAALRSELGPNSLTLLRAESWLALAHKDLVAARRGYTALLERLPGDEEASINLASVELQENHVAAAREVLSDALRTHPDSEALNGAIARFREVGH